MPLEIRAKEFLIEKERERGENDRVPYLCIKDKGLHAATAYTLFIACTKAKIHARLIGLGSKPHFKKAWQGSLVLLGLLFKVKLSIELFLGVILKVSLIL